MRYQQNILLIENNSYLSVPQVVKVEPTTTVVNPVNLSV